jgi:hypothetical protein
MSRMPYKIANPRHHSTGGADEDCESDMKMKDGTIVFSAVSAFIALNFSTKARGRLGSSIFDRPFPSTSHKPDCTTFHKLALAEIF